MKVGQRLAAGRRGPHGRRPDLFQRIAVVGYYDTPWSQAGDPPITTVNLNLVNVIDAAVELIDRIVAGQAPSASAVSVPPLLIVRDSSRWSIESDTATPPRQRSRQR